MPDENKNRHKGHRQRMHERVQQYGFASLAEHEKLEYLLYFTNGQKDTNGIAHALIERFGSFSGVLEAAPEELCKVEGVGPVSARLLHLLPQVSLCYEQSRISKKRRLGSYEEFGEYFLAAFSRSSAEHAMLLSIDTRKQIRASAWIQAGTRTKVDLTIKDIVAAALRGGTESVVLCHNHPNGMAFPSQEDMQATGDIVRALGVVGIQMLDHYIVTDTEYFSMREENRLPFYDFNGGELFWPRGSFTL